MNAHFFNKVIAGLVLIAVGALFLLNQLGMIHHFDIGYIFSTYWPVILIYSGLQGFFIRRSYRMNSAGGNIWSLFVAALGVFFLLRNLHIDGFTYENLYRYIWPVIIILLGFSMLFRGPDRHGARRREPSFDSHGPDGGTGTDRPVKYNGMDTGSRYRNGRSGMQNRSNLIGDTHLGQDYWELTPLNISHFIGDTVIDLTKASIPFGETRIQVSAFIGDVKLFVPNDILVEISAESSAFVGDMRILDRHESGLFKHMYVESPGYRDAEKKIRVQMSMFIGDVIVKRVG